MVVVVLVVVLLVVLLLGGDHTIGGGRHATRDHIYIYIHVYISNIHIRMVIFIHATNPVYTQKQTF